MTQDTAERSEMKRRAECSGSISLPKKKMKLLERRHTYGKLYSGSQSYSSSPLSPKKETNGRKIGFGMTLRPRKDPSLVVDFANLPPEILLKIFSWFSSQELYRTIGPVCKRWHQLSHHACLWKELSFRGPSVTTEHVCSILQHSPQLETLELIDRTDAEGILNQVRRTNRRLRILIIKRCRGSENRDIITAEILVSLIKRCSLITDLTIKDTAFRSTKFYQSLGHSLPRLCRINFNNNTQFDSSAVNSIASNCTALEEFRGVRSFCRSVLPHCSNKDIQILSTRMASTLKVLKLNAAALTDDAIIAITSCRCLQTLHLRYALNMTHVGIGQLVHLHNLSSLNVTMARDIPSTTWCTLFNSASWKQMKKLSVSFCSNINDDVLFSISQKCNNVEKLSLSGCIEATEQGMSYIITKCSNLRILNLYFTQVYVLQSFALIPHYTPHLETLILRPIGFQGEREILDELRMSLPNLIIRETDDPK